MEVLYESTVATLQKQLSNLTVEKMKLAQRCGAIETENGQLRQKWLSFHEQWGDDRDHDQSPTSGS